MFKVLLAKDVRRAFDELNESSTVTEWNPNSMTGVVDGKKTKIVPVSRLEYLQGIVVSGYEVHWTADDHPHLKEAEEMIRTRMFPK